MKKLNLLTFAVISLFGAAACSDDSAADGTLRVRMTDAPGVYDSVMVTINEIKVNKSGDENATGGWILLSDSVQLFNLLDLTNGNVRLLAEKPLAPGMYQQMRFKLGTKNYVVVNGVKSNLVIPSGVQSGIKLNLNAEIVSEEVYTLIVDFDASRSIRLQNNGDYRLQPVLRGARLGETGSFSGTVTPAATMPYIYAIQGADTVAGTRATETGAFKIIALSPGAYTVGVKPSLVGYASQTVAGTVIITEQNHVTLPNTIVILAN